MVMNTRKKIGLIAFTSLMLIGGFVLTKFLTRNIVKKKYITIKYIDYSTENITTTDEDN